MEIAYIEVDGRIATAYDATGFPIGQWEASAIEQEWAGYGPTACSCGEGECRHGLAHYWGVGPSPNVKMQLAAQGRYVRPY